MKRDHTKTATLLTAALLGLAGVPGCSALDQVMPHVDTVTMPTPSTTEPVEAPPTAAYKPATELGPAQNVPVPVLPVEAKEFSKEGLLAFTEYWYSTLGYAFETGDTQPMFDITGSGCARCQSIKEPVAHWNSEGRWMTGGRMTVLSMTSSFNMLDGDTYEAVAKVRQEPTKYFRADKTMDDESGSNSTIVDVMVAGYHAGRWTAIDLGHVKEDAGG